jgi:hypothetical protein
VNTSLKTVPENPTSDALHLYSELLLAIRKSLVEPLGTAPEIMTIIPDGLSTGPLPFPGNDDEALALWLDLRRHKLVIATSLGTGFELTLQRHSPHSFAEAVLEALAMLGVMVEIEMSPYSTRIPLDYHVDEATRYLEWLEAESG